MNPLFCKTQTWQQIKNIRKQIMLRQDKSTSPIKSAVKINSLYSQSIEITKNRSYSLRKISKARPILNFGTNFNDKAKNELQSQPFPQNEKEDYKNRSQSPIKSRYGILAASKLSPIKQYETKLKISAQSWLVYDYRKDTYKRGWRPADIEEYSGLARLLVIRVFLELLKDNPDLTNFNMRVNERYLKEEVEMRRQQRLPPQKRKGLIVREALTRVFGNNIVVNVIDLFHGLLMTTYDDILEYAIVFMGYLCSCHINQTEPIPDDSPCHFIQNAKEACANAEYFSQYTSSVLFPLLQMNSSSFKADSYTFYSTANDICRLYLSIENSSIFKDIISCKEVTCKIKYQIGFRYWQNRTMVFKNKRIDMGSAYSFIGRWKGKSNYSVVSRNEALNILIILQDCKFGMAECDITNIEAWVKELMNPIIDMRKTHARLLPILRIANSQSPTKMMQMNTTGQEKQKS